MKFIDHIIVTSDEPWNEIWHTQLHYAFQLSKRTRVIFLGPPDPWKFSNLFKFKQSSFSVNNSLLVVRYHNMIPAGLGKISLWINDYINTLLIKKNVLGTLKNKTGIVWHFDPHRSFYVFFNHKNWRHLFHVIDPIAGCNLDIPLAKMADLVVVTSPKFIDHYKALNKNVLKVGQGVDMNFYKEPNTNFIPSINDSKDSIMLLGTITDQINFKLLIKLAIRFPSKLVLIGPDKIQNEHAKAQFKELLAFPGVKWLGSMPPADFRHHLSVCRVGIIAYDNSVNFKNDFRSPLKVISYLACGKNIISNIDCEIGELVNKAIFNVATEENYIQLIEQSYRNELLFDKEAVASFLKSIDYSNLLKIIFKHLGQELPALK